MFKWKQENDEQLIAGLLAGRHDRFAVLVERYLPVVRSIAYARLRNGADVDDVAQETFLQAYQQLDQLRERRKFGPWVAAIARNVSTRLLKQRCQEQDIASAAVRNDAHLPDFAAAEILQAVHAQVEALDADQREVLVLHYFGGKSSKEIAVVMELSDAAVRKRLQRAREVGGIGSCAGSPRRW